MVYQGISVEQFTVQEGQFCRKPACWRINSAVLYTSMSTKNLSISCLLGNIFLLKHIYNARIKNSSASQYAVSLNCTETNNRLIFKHCSKNDKTAINYQQPHYLLYYCHLSENNENKSISYGMKGEALL